MISYIVVNSGILRNTALHTQLRESVLEFNQIWNIFIHTNIITQPFFVPKELCSSKLFSAVRLHSH